MENTELRVAKRKPLTSAPAVFRCFLMSVSCTRPLHNKKNILIYCISGWGEFMTWPPSFLLHIKNPLPNLLLQFEQQIFKAESSCRGWCSLYCLFIFLFRYWSRLSKVGRSGAISNSEIIEVSLVSGSTLKMIYRVKIFPPTHKGIALLYYWHWIKVHYTHATSHQRAPNTYWIPSVAMKS